MVSGNIVAVVLVALVAVGGCAIFFAGSGGDDSGSDEPKEKISIIDGSGKKITLDKPLERVVVGNTNIPKMCVILGIEDKITGLSFYGASSNDSNWEKYRGLFPNAKHMTIEPNLTAEEVKTVADAVIVPVSSMTIQAAKEKSYKEMGITVIRLDCNGDTAQEDMEKLTILFGQSDKIMSNYNEYWKMYNSVKDTVVKKVKESSISEYRFLNFFGTGDAFYNHTSASSEMIETLKGRNALRDIKDLNTSGISNKAGELGIVESIREMDAKTPVDKFFFRGNLTLSTPDAAVSIFKDSVIYSRYISLNPVKTGEVFMFASDPMSGCMSHVAYVLIAEALGVDTGYTASELVKQYNERYGFNERTTGLAFQITVNGDNVTAKEIST